MFSLKLAIFKFNTTDNNYHKEKDALRGKELKINNYLKKFSHSFEKDQQVEKSAIKHHKFFVL